MNIFHQLRTGGDPDMKDVYAEVPWVELKEYPGQSDEELLERWKVCSSRECFHGGVFSGQVHVFLLLTCNVLALLFSPSLICISLFSRPCQRTCQEHSRRTRHQDRFSSFA